MMCYVSDAGVGFCECRSDCGIFTCFIIRQYIRGVEVDTTMDGLTPTGLRAAMVDMFLSDLSDPGSRLRGRTL